MEDVENNIEDVENNVEDKSEKFEEDKDNNEDSKHHTNNENLLTNENSDQDDSDDIALEEINDINIETKEYLNDKAETEDEESRHITSEQSDDDDEGLWEDIYGRQRDKKGNIVSKKYVPPSARIANTNISVNDEKAHRLERQLKGILNRLAEQNMHTIGNQVIYMNGYECICNICD